jgi:aryl-alcohol dehydrogenase-like predicted oxidoreductase
VATVIAGADLPAHVERNVHTLATPVPDALLEELSRGAP